MKMESKKQTYQTSRQRKLLLVLPLLALPFLTVLFWAMGGGKGEMASVTEPQKGFNVKLPDAKINEEDPLNKLNYYDRAALDSLKLEELKKKDPNYTISEPLGAAEDSLGTQEQSKKATGLMMSSFRDPNEEKVYKKLEALQKAINTTPAPKLSERAPVPQTNAIAAKSDIQAMEQTMQSFSGAGEEDKEMQQINGMLQSILDIQHPERVQERLKKTAQEGRGQVYSVKTDSEPPVISLLENNARQGIRSFGPANAHNGFYSLDDTRAATFQENAIQATIAETQTLVNGSTVKLRLSQDISVNGTVIRKDTFIYGVAALKGERLIVEISGLRFGSSVFPVELTLFDMDGLEGIYIPGAINRDVAKASADRSMQALGVTTLDDSWGSQAAGAGIEAAKSLFSKKVKLVKVVVKAGYQVLLRDTKLK
jgi:conjugative transposon TraM protein